MAVKCNISGNPYDQDGFFKKVSKNSESANLKMWKGKFEEFEESIDRWIIN